MHLSRNTAFLHFAARTRAGFPLFKNPEIAQRTWLTLRELLPASTLAAVLMPEHLHWLVRIPRAEAGDLQRSLEIRLGMLASAAGQRAGLWNPLHAPKEVADHKHLQRTVRYILLNPNRRALTDDPLVWRWSTALDLIGAVPDPWVSATRLARELQWSSENFVSRFLDHLYRDETVPARTPSLLLPPLPSTAVPIHTLAQIRDAFARAHRIEPERLRPKSLLRTRFLYTATSLHWDLTRHIAAFAGIDRRNALRLRKKWALAAKEPRHRAELRATRLMAENPRWASNVP